MFKGQIRQILIVVVLIFACTTIFAQSSQKRTIYILATGGTIAGSGNSNVGSQYTAGEVGIVELLEAVPEIENIANIKGEQIVKIGSQDMTDDIMLTLAKRVNELLASEEVDGVVITHGTDTMEESAYFLTLTTKSDKPVVFVGSMRPSTAISADGPKNLLNSVVVAADPQSKGRGVLLAMNDKIYDAKGVTKTHTMEVETFDSPNSGAIGYINNQKVIYTQKPDYQHTLNTPFDISNINALPKVAIVYGHSSVDRDIIDAIIESDYKGIVYAGVGNGNIHKNVFPALEQAVKKGISVVRATRVPNGAVTDDAEIDDTKYGFIAAELLNAQKARILLMLSLAEQFNTQQIRQQFNK